MNSCWLYQMIKRTGKACGIPDIHTHRFRHHFAMAALESNIAEQAVKLICQPKENIDTQPENPS